jgi:hypothetical protein
MKLITKNSKVLTYASIPDGESFTWFENDTMIYMKINHKQFVNITQNRSIEPYIIWPVSESRSIQEVYHVGEYGVCCI